MPAFAYWLLFCAVVLDMSINCIYFVLTKKYRNDIERITDTFKTYVNKEENSLKKLLKWSKELTPVQFRVALRILSENQELLEKVLKNEEDDDET